MKKTIAIEMSTDDQQDFVDRIGKSALVDSDKEIVKGLIEFNNWLQFSLEEKSISIERLSKMFGNSSEKKSKKKVDKSKKTPEENGSENDQNSQETAEDQDSEQANFEQEETEPLSPENSASTKKQEDAIKKTTSKNQNHPGRLSHQDYFGAEIIEIPLPYQIGDPCPELGCTGKLKRSTPSYVIKITGQSFAKATKYELAKLRCNLCDQYFTAKLPDNVPAQKYDNVFKSHLCVYKHHLGVPNYRLEGYQKYIGVPLPDSTQWDKTEEVAKVVIPVFICLENYAANAYLTYGDDTRVKILSVGRRSENDKKPNRKGTFTTGVVACHENKQIHLFYSGKKHAGENMLDLLRKRDPSLPKSLHMCDALSSNMPKELKAILINCLVHSRRNFFEIEKFFPEECAHALEIFRTIYKNEADVRQLKLDDQARLNYHKQHSRPSLKAFYQWILKQFKEKQIEPNSSLGKACKYMLKHAKRLTRFLRIPGAPLDNNICERSLKMAIRVRKNSLFYATEHGAYIGGVLQSVIHTCLSANEDPVKYLTALQDHSVEVANDPTAWMPWNYQKAS